jgi:hypothetical protein
MATGAVAAAAVIARDVVGDAMAAKVVALLAVERPVVRSALLTSVAPIIGCAVVATGSSLARLPHCSLFADTRGIDLMGARMSLCYFQSMCNYCLVGMQVV